MPARSRSRSFSRSPSRTPSRSRSRSRSASYSRSPSPAPPNPLADGCPFLIRVFVLRNKHNPVIEYDQKRFPEEEYWVYAWKHSTPTQLLKQLYAKLPAAYRAALRFSLRHIYVDAEEDRLYKARDLVSFTPAQLRGTLGSGATTTSPSAPDEDDAMDRKEQMLDQELADEGADGRGRGKVAEKTLDEYGFLTGDLLSLCVALPRPPKAAGTLKAGAGAEPRGGAWGRGEPLPPQELRGGRGGGRGGRGAPEGDRWRRARSRSPARGEGWRR